VRFAKRLPSMRIFVTLPSSWTLRIRSVDMVKSE
jgi:hypothetical protein